MGSLLVVATHLKGDIIHCYGLYVNQLTNSFSTEKLLYESTKVLLVHSVLNVFVDRYILLNCLYIKPFGTTIANSKINSIY